MHDLLIRSVQHHPKLEPLDLKATNSLKLRTMKIVHADANMFQGDFSLDSDSLDSFPQQIRAALHRRPTRFS